tara:strand:+ start:289 stop:777 length:489 start_codon:yes stop_codon:yes gene_type:complete
MGFDLNGLQPKIEEGTTLPTIDWKNKPSEEEKSDYFRDLEEFHNLNPGVYFRNNIWWWHPMWSFIGEFMGGDVLSDQDKERGHFNDGYKINAIKANYIADQINKYYFNGELEKAALQLDKIRDEELTTKPKTDEILATVPFSVANCLEFGTFARNSGGFTID